MTQTHPSKLATYSPRHKNAQNILIRIANEREQENPSFAGAGAWFDYMNPDSQGRYAVVIRPDKLIGTNAFFGKAGIDRLFKAITKIIYIPILIAGCSSVPTMTETVSSIASHTTNPDAGSKVNVNDQPACLLPTVEPDGTPLPTPNKNIQCLWPENFRKFLDDSLNAFSIKDARNFDPITLEKKINISISEFNIRDAERGDGYYKITKIPIQTNKRRISTLQITHTNKSTLYILEIYLSPVDLCINPYHFAIFTGEKYTPVPGTDSYSVTDDMRLAYEWGMFKRARHHAYLQIGEMPILKIGTNNDCLTSIHFSASTTKESRK